MTDEPISVSAQHAKGDSLFPRITTEHTDTTMSITFEQKDVVWDEPEVRHSIVPFVFWALVLGGILLWTLLTITGPDSVFYQ